MKLDIKFPNISIIIPYRNEEMFIGRCLAPIIANNYPKERLEVLVIDGMSKNKPGGDEKRNRITGVLK